ncbi:MAG: SdrD B-like domain-containing protein [Leadbetterella sp.]
MIRKKVIFDFKWFNGLVIIFIQLITFNAFSIHNSFKFNSKEHVELRFLQGNYDFGRLCSNSSKGSIEPLNITHTPITFSAVIGDRVWFDANKNGIMDVSENGFEGIVVKLLDISGNPVLDVNGNLVDSTITDLNGNYQFINLRENQPCVLRFYYPNGYTATDKNVGDDLTDSDITNVSISYGESDVITLLNGESRSDIDLGLRTITAFATYFDHFSVKKNSKGNLLQWKIIPNVKNIDLQKSNILTDEFTTIRVFSGNEFQNYSFLDTKDVLGIKYYALKIHFIDGSESTSSIVSAVNSYADDLLSIYPNPSSEGIYFIKSDVEVLNLKIYNSKGGEVLGRLVGKDQITISSTNSGIYFFYLFTEKGLHVKTIIKN